MAEAFGIAAGGLTVLEVTTKVVKQCKTLIESAHDAPRDLRHILIEISSLKAVLESFEFLSQAGYSDTAKSLADANGVVEGCRKTVEELSRELDGLSLANTSHVNLTLGKRRRVMGTLEWCLKESKTRKLLDEAMRHKTTLTLALLGEITSDVKVIKSTVEQVQDRITNADRREMCDWIEQTNPTSIHHRACRNHEKNTCQWIHRVEQWNDWLNLQRRLIWIHGIPGAGKTVLASYLIEQTLTYCETIQNSRIICLYYYCSFIHGQEDRRDESLPFLRWVISQLCRRSEHVPASLIAHFKNKSEPSFQALKEALRSILVRFDVLYIVVDAVDESNPRDDLLSLIQDLVTQADYAKIQLLVTSRRYADIEEVLRPLSEPSLPMSNSIVDEDIRIYIDTTMQGTKHFAKWSGTLRKDIAISLAQGAQGMFRWVVCQIDRLLRKSPRQAREAIKCLPQTLEDTYEIILLEIPQDDWHTARTALQWICGHTDLECPYGIPANCLSSAVLSSERAGMSEFSEGGHQHEFLKAILGCLIEVGVVEPELDPTDWPRGHIISIDGDPDHTCLHTITLAHYTIQEFLFSNRVTTSRVSYFAMSQEACAQKMLETALQPSTTDDCTCASLDTEDSFEQYCHYVVRKCAPYWESIILQNEAFWGLYSDFFIDHTCSWSDMLTDYESASRASTAFNFQATNDLISMANQFLMALLAIDCVDMAKKVLERLQLETALSNLVPFSLEGYAFNNATILDALGAHSHSFSPDPYYILVDCLISRTELPKLFLFCLQSHYHEWICRAKSCVIIKLLNAGANANLHCSLLTPLQIAVRNWDLGGVKILLEHGAAPNDIGQPDGYIPTHIDTTWAQATPLHILRNAGYGIMAKRDFAFPLLMGERELHRHEIEALLLKYGATDFVRSESEDDAFCN